MKATTVLLGFAALLSSQPATAAPTVATVPPSPDMLSITCLYTASQCAQDKSYWFITTGVQTWDLALSKTNGCQPVNASWAISSAKAGYLGDGCTLSFYTDTECVENGAQSRVDECVTASTTDTGKLWKSFAIRGCAATKAELRRWLGGCW